MLIFSVKSKCFGKSHAIEVKIQKYFYKSCTREKKYKDIRVGILGNWEFIIFFSGKKFKLPLNFIFI